MKTIYSIDFIGIRFRGDKVSFASSGSRNIEAANYTEAQGKLTNSLGWGHFDTIKYHPVVDNCRVKTPKFPVTLHI